ncbi:hypothetical protein Tco_0183373 [Tanacetum coccineum]
MSKNHSHNKGNKGSHNRPNRGGFNNSSFTENPNKGAGFYSRGYPNPKPQEFVVDPNDFPAIGANLATTVPRAVSSPKVVENEKTHDVTMHSDGSARVPLNNTSTCHDDAFGSDSSSSMSPIYTIDDVASKFDVYLNSVVEVEAFADGIQKGKYPNWFLLPKEMSEKFVEIVCARHNELSNAKKSNQVPIVNDTIVESVDVNNQNYPADDPVFDGVNVSLPRRVVKKVESRLEHTLYGYFLGQRLAFPVVEYFANNNWAKHGLKRIMMNNKGFFFFKFDSRAGMEAVLEGGPWLIRKTPIILKTWTMGTRLLKEELSRIPIWVKFHDVPIQVFEEEGINLIASFIGKPIMFDSFTSAMCKESWGRSSFARCLIEVNSDAELVDVVTIGVPSLISEDFTKETIRVEYEWKPPRCDTCKIFGHTIDHCPLKVVSSTNANSSNVVPPMDSANDGFLKVTKKRRNKNRSKPSNGYKMVVPSVRYEPKDPKKDQKKNSTSYVASTSEVKNTTPIVDSTGPLLSDSQNKSQIASPNSFSALAQDIDDEVVANDESTNLLNPDDSS